jgi:hypothetical protein
MGIVRQLRSDPQHGGFTRSAPLVQLPTRPFLDNFLAADDTELTLQAPPDHNRNTEGDFTLLFSSD